VADGEDKDGTLERATTGEATAPGGRTRDEARHVPGDTEAATPDAYSGDVDRAGDLLWGGRGVAAARCVLFDFDGPVCRLFPEGRSMPVAERLRAHLAQLGLGGLLSAEERADKDPHVVLRAVHRAGRERDLGDLVGTLEHMVTEGEVRAAGEAWPTADADGLIRRLHEGGAALAVVTNNSARAADRYLREHAHRGRSLRDFFTAVHGRGPDPDLMKPHPDVLTRALTGLGLPPDSAVMIGDTPTDAEAARAAGVRFIGYGRDEAKRARLRRAGAGVVIGSYAPLLHTAETAGVCGRRHAQGEPHDGPGDGAPRCRCGARSPVRSLHE
jgi:HAD superfamily hydrolase (TIGR01549 family)